MSRVLLPRYWRQYQFNFFIDWRKTCSRAVLVACLALGVCVVSALAVTVYPDHQCFEGYYTEPPLFGMCGLFRDPLPNCGATTNHCDDVSWAEWNPGMCDPLEGETCNWGIVFGTLNVEVEEYCHMDVPAEYCDCRIRLSRRFRTEPQESCW